MNNKLVFTVVFTMCLFGAAYAAQAGSSGSSSSSGLPGASSNEPAATAPTNLSSEAVCAICLSPLRKVGTGVDSNSATTKVSGQEIFNCKCQCAYHQHCIYEYDADGKQLRLKFARCPFCRAGKSPGRVAVERRELLAYVNTRDSQEMANELAHELAQDDPEEVPIVLPHYPDLVCPDGLPHLIWHAALRSLLNSDNTELTLSHVGLTTEQLNLLLRALPLNLKKRINDVNLSHNQLTFFGRKDLVNVQRLDLSYNQLENVLGLRRLPKLTDLNVSDNYLSDLIGLGLLGRIEELDISDNQFAELSDLARLTELRYFLAYHNLFTQLSELDQLQNLSNVEVDAPCVVSDALIERVDSFRRI